MAFAPSSLSLMSTAVQEFLRDGLDANANHIQVSVGAPADVSKAPAQGDKKHRVNLFFYRFEPAGFGHHERADEPWLIRLHCLITVFGEVEDKVSAGEHELRILGEVMRLFHEHPVTDSVTLDGYRVRLQTVFQPLSAEELNQIWSTQVDTTYRPSVAYEMAAGMIVPEEPYTGAPLAGALGQQVFADMGQRHAAFGGQAAPPPVAPASVDTRVESWAPAVCFVHGGVCVQSVALASASPEAAAFSPASVWVAGDPAATVTLRWEVWDPSGGWRSEGATVDTTPLGPSLDPETPPAGGLAAIDLPFTDHQGQAVLYAERRYTPGAGGAQRTVRSNPLLVSFY